MIKKENVKYFYNLSPLQEGIFFHSCLNPSSSSYFNQVCIRINGNLNIKKLEKSFQTIIDRNDILRTVFIKNTSTLLQVVLKNLKCDFFSLSFKEQHNIATFLTEYKSKDRDKGFDLESNLMRLSIIQLNNDEYEFIWSYHHILLDGWCLPLLIKEFFDIYKELVINDSLFNLQEPIPYINYIRWLDKIDKSLSLKHWSDYLTDYNTSSTLPKSFQFNGYNSCQSVYQLSEIDTSKLKSLSKTYNVTLNSIVQSIWGILLSKYNNSDDVVFGGVVSGRPSEIDNIDQIIGLFINTIPVRIKVNPIVSFIDLVLSVQKQAILNSDHQYIQLADIQKLPELGRDLIDHVLIFENYPITNSLQENLESTDLNLSVINIEIFEQTNYDINVIFIPGTKLSVKFNFNQNSYSKQAIEGIWSHFKKLIDNILIDPLLPINKLDYLSPHEKHKLLHEFNSTTVPYTKDETVITLFENQVIKTPNSIALVYENVNLTYQALNAHSNQLAYHLKEKFDIRVGDLIGLKTKRSDKMIIGLLGILKAGAAYIPIDVSYPNERINYIIADSKIKLLISDVSDNCSECPVLILQIEELRNPSNPITNTIDADLAYIMYTSGTTGFPKGVMIDHRSIINLICNNHDIAIKQGRRLLQTGSLSFDATTFEIWGTLLNGGELNLIKQSDLLDNSKLKDYLKKRKISAVFFTTSWFNQLVEDNIELFSAFDCVITGGERVSFSNVTRLKKTYPKLLLLHAYGPTEATTFSLLYPIKKVEKGVIPIGSPISNTRLYILDNDRQLLPLGVPGELYISGAGLARGYLNNVELTNDRFVPNPFFPGERMYKTGDNCRWLPTGEVEFIGRSDHQVKLRGYRIELGEIENALLSHESVADAVVLLREAKDGSKYLCGYVVLKAFSSSAELKSHLQNILPAYMIPSYIMELKHFPLTTNGKLDRKTLPDPILEGALPDREYAEPSSDFERQLIAIWQEVLGYEKISIHDNFFDLGGHSLKAIQLVSRIRKTLKIEIELKDIFKYPTLSLLTAYLNSSQPVIYSPIIPVEYQQEYTLSNAQKRLWYAWQMDKKSKAFNITVIKLLEGILDTEVLTNSVEKLVMHHESLRTIYKDINGEPYQRILNYNESDFTLKFHHLTNAADKDGECENIVQEYLNHSFNLEKGPLFKMGIIILEENKYKLVLLMHHIISDGWSMELLMNQLVNLYYSKKTGFHLEKLRIQYKDYAKWHNNLLKSRMIKEEKFWQEKLLDIPRLNLKIDFPRPELRTYNTKILRYTFDPDMIEGLMKINRSQNVSLYVVLISIVKVLLSFLSDRQEIGIGIPVSGRNHSDLEGQIGFFINMLVLRSKLNDDFTFNDLVVSINQTVTDALDNQNYPFELLVDKFYQKNDPSRNPFFDVEVDFHDFNVLKPIEKVVDSEELIISDVILDKSLRGKYDLDFIFAKKGESVILNLYYNSDLFKEETINSLNEMLILIARMASENPSVDISEIKKNLRKLNESELELKKTKLKAQSIARLNKLKNTFKN